MGSGAPCWRRWAATRRPLARSAAQPRSTPAAQTRTQAAATRFSGWAATQTRWPRTTARRASATSASRRAARARRPSRPWAATTRRARRSPAQGAGPSRIPASWHSRGQSSWIPKAVRPTRPWPRRSPASADAKRPPTSTAALPRSALTTLRCTRPTPSSSGPCAATPTRWPRTTAQSGSTTAPPRPTPAAQAR